MRQVTKNLVDPPVAPDLPLDVYLPPGYETNNDQRYPLLLIIGGPGMKETGQFIEIADQLFSSGEKSIKPAIMVIPKGRAMPGVEKRIVEMMDKEFRTITDRNGRSVIGFGFTGGTALGVIGSNSDLFGGVAVQSPLVFDAEVRKVIGDFEKIDEPTAYIWIGVGMICTIRSRIGTFERHRSRYSRV